MGCSSTVVVVCVSVSAVEVDSSVFVETVDSSDSWSVLVAGCSPSVVGFSVPGEADVSVGSLVVVCTLVVGVPPPFPPPPRISTPVQPLVSTIPRVAKYPLRSIALSWFCRGVNSSASQDLFRYGYRSFAARVSVTSSIIFPGRQ